MGEPPLQEEPAEFEETEDFAEEEGPRQKKGCLFVLRLLAFVLLITFTALLLADMLQLFRFSGLVRPWMGPPLSEDPALRRLQRAVVLIECLEPEGGRVRRGTGFNIDPYGLIVTNRHLVQGVRSVSVFFKDGTTLRSTRWKESSRDDLALISLDGNALPAVGLAGSLPLPGTRILIIGYPQRQPGLTVNGRVRGYPESQGRRLMLLDAAVGPGHSGSPVFTGGGEVAGVVFATVQAPREGDRALAVPASGVRQLLEEARAAVGRGNEMPAPKNIRDPGEGECAGAISGTKCCLWRLEYAAISRNCYRH